ncbi:hypothetical protein AC629_42700 [Bradyrhizobium sp. NAS80.1]|nr:hypothetical protein AC629_42700 [Bradyrhizobium sp. NAS80.1]
MKSKTYSGGASITVGWIDGPTAKLVESVTGAYAGGGFDGMIDLAYSNYAWLMPDGTAAFAKTRGTAGSMGTVPSAQQMQPSFKSELVRFGADYVFTERRYSPAFYERAASKVARKYGEDLAVKVSDWGTPMLARDIMVDGAAEWASTLVYQELARRMPAEV